MKKRMMMVLAAVLALLLTAGCGSTKEETKSVDLTEFYNGLAEEYEWGENYMASIEGDLLESYYPGLGGHLHQAVHRHDASDVLRGQ